MQAGENLNLKDLCNGVYAPKRIQAVTPLNDGIRYAQLSSDAKQIIAYSFKSGEQTEVLFDVTNTKGKKKLDRIDGYIMSPDEKNILIQTETKPIYRRSKTAIYYIYNATMKSSGEPSSS